jgi:hypothetical protein
MAMMGILSRTKRERLCIAALFTSVIPAQAGIPYTPAVRRNPKGRRILGHPVKPGDDKDSQVGLYPSTRSTFATTAFARSCAMIALRCFRS